MIHPNGIPICESFDDSDFDLAEVRDLVRAAPPYLDDCGLRAGYEAEQLFGLDDSLKAAFHAGDGGWARKRLQFYRGWGSTVRGPFRAEGADPISGKEVP